MGNIVDIADELIRACTEAGVIFHPSRGQLRPELTRGRPPDTLLAQVKEHREAILIRLSELMDFDDDTEEATTC